MPWVPAPPCQLPLPIVEEEFMEEFKALFNSVGLPAKYPHSDTAPPGSAPCFAEMPCRTCWGLTRPSPSSVSKMTWNTPIGKRWRGPSCGAL